MSHFTTIQTQVRDIDALREACAELGVTLEPSTTARGYSGNAIKGDYVIRLNGPYDVALNRQQDGSYGLTADWWSGHVAREVGENYGRLLQLYGVHKASREARSRGYSVRRVPVRDGNIKLVIEGV